jgi:tRNA (guanine-N7-)-methyltransferase
MIDPNDFVITRKRKKYKFAKFANSPICFELDEWKKIPVDVVEVGAGTGQFSVELAERNPSKVYVAVDVKADRLQKGAYEAVERGLANIYFIRARADQLPELFAEKSLESIWVTFPDPFLKQRSAGRRLTHPTYLKTYASLLKNDGAVRLKHDSEKFFHWSLEQFVAQDWRITELSFDLHESGLSDEYKIMTTYEKRWIREGFTTNFVKVQKIS